MGRRRVQENWRATITGQHPFGSFQNDFAKPGLFQARHFRPKGREREREREREVITITIIIIIIIILIMLRIAHNTNNTNSTNTLIIIILLLVKTMRMIIIPIRNTTKTFCAVVAGRMQLLPEACDTWETQVPFHVTLQTDVKKLVGSSARKAAGVQGDCQGSMSKEPMTPTSAPC